jgi:acetyl-CoA acyltransferase
MGQSAEKMAKDNGIARADQDAWALRSHQLAHAGTKEGRLAAEIAPYVVDGTVVDADSSIRSDTNIEQMTRLGPVFDRQYGTITAASASPLSDGASGVLLMAEEAARALGYTPLAFLRSHALTAVDPGGQLLMGPVFAVPLALERAGIGWHDLGLIEMHEAFAAQVLSNVKGFEERHGWNVDAAMVNVMGGSIAIGHPFGATGARLVTSLANEMRRRRVQFGLVSVCAQGGLGSALVLESAA